jgi:long-chain acyl-CoA synthetase
VRAGATLHLRPGSTPPGRWLEVLHDQQITVLPGVPTLWQLLTTLGGNRPLPALRLLTNAGAALPPPLLARLLAAFPEAGVLAMYGQTECARVCFLPADQVDRHPQSVGYPLPGTRAWVVGADDTELPAGAVGELLVQGDHVMQGYWGDPAATARKLRPDGVMRTGDLFRRDAQGRLSFVARLDDVITTRGEKVAPLEVERVLCTAPGVREAAVVGAPDERLGECVVAHVAPQPGQTLDALALRRFCARHLESAKVPGRVQLHQDLPRLPGGKVDRLALRALSG